MKERTRAEWRELGFFYDLNEGSKEWLLIGSRAGLLRFSELLRGYATNPRREGKSEHDHYGPYMYLKVMTWPTAGMDAGSIHGTLGDLERLASSAVVDRRQDLPEGLKPSGWLPNAEFAKRWLSFIAEKGLFTDLSTVVISAQRWPVAQRPALSRF